MNCHLYSDLSRLYFLDFSYSFMRCISKSYSLYFSFGNICYYPHWCPEFLSVEKGYSRLLDFNI